VQMDHARSIGCRFPQHCKIVLAPKDRTMDV